MKVTKQQKILLGIVLAGGLALTCDRIFFLDARGGQTAAGEYAVAPVPAAATADSSIAPALPTAVISTAKAAATKTISVAQRLRGAAAASAGPTTRDAFAFVGEWGTPVEAPPQAVVPAGPRPEDVFRESHHLSGLLISGGVGHAVIDGQIVAIGESLDGFKLVSVSHRAATFQSGNTRVVLGMTEGSGTANAVADTRP